MELLDEREILTSAPGSMSRKSCEFDYGPSLHEHVHFHVCVIDSVCEDVANDVVADGEPCQNPEVLKWLEATLKKMRRGAESAAAVNASAAIY
jgi:hypothetical protein